MTLAALAVAYERFGGVGEYERRLWKLIAFLGRYGKQPADTCLAMPMGDLLMLASSVSEIMVEEGFDRDVIRYKGRVVFGGAVMDYRGFYGGIVG